VLDFPIGFFPGTAYSALAPFIGRSILNVSPVGSKAMVNRCALNIGSPIRRVGPRRIGEAPGIPHHAGGPTSDQ
jgi:hypothetical protein